MFLTENITINEHNVTHDNKFEVKCSARYYNEYSGLAFAQIVTYNVKIKNGNGDEFIIGSKRGLIYLAETVPVIIEASIPQELSAGEYSMFIQLTDPDIKDPAREKIYGYTSDIIDELKINIT
jgi:hypothetical protein